MKLTKECFKINSEKVSKKLEKFIRIKVKEYKKQGIATAISGGLDSTTILKLCINAVGKDNVIGILLPEGQGNPEAKKYAKFVAKKFGIKTKTFDISNSLRNLGVYNFPLSYIPGRKLRAWVVRKFMNVYEKKHGKKAFGSDMEGKKDKFFLGGRANSNAKQRMRMVYLYYFADKNNLLVVGSAHLSEDLTGLFVKFGVDDNADIMPLKDLYRTQILQLAEYLNVPKEVIERSPNPDVIPGIEDKYVDLLGISYDKVDLILYGLDKGMKVDNIAKELKITEKKKVNEIKELVKYSEFLRQGAIYPKIK